MKKFVCTMSRELTLGITFFLLSCAPMRQSAQCNTASTIPYYEAFGGLSSNNQLPACWAISNPSYCLTYSVGGGYAAFSSAGTGTNYFYTNSLLLNSGVVYSVCIWRRVDLQGSTNWSSLQLYLSPAQNTSSLTFIAGTSILSNTVYTSLSGTF